MISKSIKALSFVLAGGLAASASADVPQAKKISGKTKFQAYTANKPTKVNIEVDFVNGTGKYYPGNGKVGKLSRFDFNNGAFDMGGVWELDGKVGTFTWSFEGNSFTGSFRFNQNLETSELDSIYFPPDGSWDGNISVAN